MKYLLLVLAALLLPGASYAQAVGASATSNSGGNTVGAGGTVKTGAEVSSVQVTNISGEGQSSIYIKTDVNGAVHEETIIDASGVVDVSIEADGSKAQVEIRQGNPAAVVKKVYDTSVPASITTISSTTGASSTISGTVVSEPPRATGIIQSIFAWLGTIFSFWL